MMVAWWFQPIPKDSKCIAPRNNMGKAPPPELQSLRLFFRATRVSNHCGTVQKKYEKSHGLAGFSGP